MARQEIPREDLLRDAHALVCRGELRVDGLPDHVVIGFRANGAGSVYFGEDPALHFTTDNRLRRAYIGGLLYKANEARLTCMRRVRAEGEVQLRSSPLSDPQQRDLLTGQHRRLVLLLDALSAERCELVGQVPADGEFLPRATAWLAALVADPLTPADAPGVR